MHLEIPLWGRPAGPPTGEKKREEGDRSDQEEMRGKSKGERTI